ncbi:DUF5123 domain-containing protein [Candidatus Dojkabacteria bacterium]|nr:DUF5123 domain-containing protein [Candidatus Dojkabacteria bacterium]
MSIILFTLRLTKGRSRDANIKQEKKDLAQYRVRYYPTLVTVLTTLLFIILQTGLFITGGMVVMNVRVESIFAAGEGSTTLNFNTETQETYTYSEEQLSFTSSGVTLELVEVTPEVPEEVDPESGELIQEAQDAVYEYNTQGEAILTITQAIEYTELLGFTEESSVVDTEGNPLTDNTSTSIKYQISNDNNTWYYTDSSEWIEAGLISSEANTESELNNNISTFPEQLGLGDLYIKIFLTSTDVQYSPKLTSISIQTEEAIITPITTQDEIVTPSAPDPTLTEYYVDGVAGDDNNSGTSALPLKTIQAAADVADAGDTVYVKGGIVYTDTNSCGGGQSVVCIVNSGASGSPITFTVWPQTGIPMIDASDVSNVFNINTASYNTIEGFQMDSYFIGISIGAGGSGDHNIIKNNMFKGGRSGSFGPFINFSQTDIFFLNNTVYENGSTSGVIQQAGSIQVENNIITNSNIGVNLMGGSLSNSSNLYWNNTSNCVGCTIDATSIDSDPLFTDPASGDFTLQSTSPAIDAGADLTGTVDTDIRGLARPNAGGHDIGAYEDGNLYVAGDTGDDMTGDGSASAPWATIQKAADNTTPGDTVNVKGGVTYTDSNINSNVGNATNRIVYRAWENTGIPIVDTSGDFFNILEKYNDVIGFHIISDIKPIDTARGENRILNNVFKSNFIWHAGIRGNNTIISNNTFYGDAYYGIHLDFVEQVVTIENNIFLGVLDTAIHAPVSSDGVTLNNNIFYNNNSNANFSINETNITSDPQFLDAAGGDFRLMGNSPGIDAGADVTGTITTDITGKPRSLEGGVDIGAYENITQYYVAGDTGSDSNIGTESSPFKTIQKGADVAVAGNTVNVKGGITYNNVTNCYLEVLDSPLCITNSGKADSRIVYNAWEGTGIPIINGVMGDVGVKIDADYINFTGFEIIYAQSIGLGINGSNVTVNNNIFNVNNQRGIDIKTGLSDINITNNTIYATGYGIYVDVNASSNNIQVQNNIISDTSFGSVLTGSGYIPVYSNNGLWNNSVTNYWGESSGENDVLIDPQFLDPTNGDFRLMGNSPAIDAGADVSDIITTDITGKPRNLEGGTDIGAYENIVNYYVDGENGDDGNLGTMVAPFKTIQKGADEAVAGNTVYVKGGITYSDANNCGGGQSVVCVANSGNSETPITYTSWPGTGVPLLDVDSYNSGFHLNTNSYVNISNFHITNFSLAAFSLGAGGSGGNNIISNNILSNSGDGASGSIFNLSQTNISILNNTIIDITGNPGLSLYGGSTTVSNNIIGKNSIGIVLVGGSLSENHNVFWDNTQNCSGCIVDGTSLITDPLFTDANNGDFTLQSASPAIDAGDDNVLSEVTTDILGTARPQEEGIDIGAYENYELGGTTTAFRTADSTPVVSLTTSTIGEYAISSVECKLSTESEWTSIEGSSVAVNGSLDSSTEELSLEYPAALEDGDYIIQLRVTDSNNTTKTYSAQIQIDTTAEKITITEIGTVEGVPSQDELTYYYTVGGPEIRGTGEVPSELALGPIKVYFELIGDNDEVLETYSTEVDSEGNYTLEIDPILVSGAHVFKYYQIDDLGNTSERRTLNLSIGEENFPEWLLRKLGLLSEDGKPLQEGGELPEGSVFEKVSDSIEEEKNKLILLTYGGIILILILSVVLVSGYVVIRKQEENLTSSENIT